MRLISILAGSLALAACGPSERDYERDAYATADEAAVAAANDAAVYASANDIAADAEATATYNRELLAALSNDDKGRVCRAAIASLNGRDPEIIRVISTDGDIHRVRYTRDDGTVWTNECRVGANTAEWRMVENGRPGRWRNEDTIRFNIDGPRISIQTFMMGDPMTSDTYEIR